MKETQGDGGKFERHKLQENSCMKFHMRGRSIDLEKGWQSMSATMVG